MRRLTWFLVVLCFLSAPMVRSDRLANLLIAGSIALAVLKVVAAVFRGDSSLHHPDPEPPR